MPYTWGQLKTDVRQILWPAGEAPNLVASHDKAFVDGMCDLQQFVPCLQQDNTSVFPACSTYYRCGLTLFQAPRGIIKKVSVIGSDPTTTDPDFCKEIEYTQIGAQYISDWMKRWSRDNCGCYLNFAAFFSLDPMLCRKAAIPVPTDIGVPAGLPPLQLGVHYPQGSTDRIRRSRAGVWAIERGVIHLAPWINVAAFSESVVVVWDGIKRTWSECDPVDPDPLLSEALEEYVRSEHARKHDRDFQVADTAGQAYSNARTKLWHNCRMETAVRGKEASQARNSVPSITAASLYYSTIPYTANATADTSDCPTGQTATATTSGSFTVHSGEAWSTVSVADANAKAQQKAQQQAAALALSKLVCTDTGTGGTGGTGGGGGGGTGGGSDPLIGNDYTSVTVSCPWGLCEDGVTKAPQPDGSSVTVNIAANRYFFRQSEGGKDTANKQAQIDAQNQAQAQLNCIFHNCAETAYYTCQDGTKVSSTIAANTKPQYDSRISQQNSNSGAYASALNAATLLCPGASKCGNDEQSYTKTGTGWGGCTLTVRVVVPFNTLHGGCDVNAHAAVNNSALQIATDQAVTLWNNYNLQKKCGVFTVSYT